MKGSLCIQPKDDAVSSTYDINYKKVNVEMSNGAIYSGRLNIRDFRRASDFFRHTEEQFYLMVVVMLDESEKVLMLNKNFIVCIEEEIENESQC